MPLRLRHSGIAPEGDHILDASFDQHLGVRETPAAAAEREPTRGCLPDVAVGEEPPPDAERTVEFVALDRVGSGSGRFMGDSGLLSLTTQQVNAPATACSQYQPSLNRRRISPTEPRSMANPSSPDLLGHLGRLLNGSIGVAQFWDWLVEADDAIEAHGSDAEDELARAVDLRFGEYTSGHISANRLLYAIRREVAESGLRSPEVVETVPRSA
jgi:hypothetical protein